jgi:hypothetical protein
MHKVTRVIRRKVKKRLILLLKVNKVIYDHQQVIANGLQVQSHKLQIFLSFISHLNIEVRTELLSLDINHHKRITYILEVQTLEQIDIEPWNGAAYCTLLLQRIEFKIKVAEKDVIVEYSIDLVIQVLVEL